MFKTLKQQKLATVICMSLAFLCSVFVSNQFKNRGHYTGDDYSSDAVWTSGNNFDRLGFWNLRFVPVQNFVLERSDVPLETPEKFYTHYPPGSDYFQGALFKLGFHSRESHQFVALFISLIGAYFFLKALLIFFSPLSAVLAWIVYLFSPSFLFFSDNLQQFPWFTLFKGVFLWRLATLFYKNQSTLTINRQAVAIEMFLFGFVASWFSFDSIPGFLALAILIPILSYPKFQLRFSLFLMMLPVLGEVSGFCLHILKNGWVLGGVQGALQDIAGAFQLRAGMNSGSTENSPYSLARHLGKLVLSIQWFFTLPVFALSFYGWCVALKKKSRAAIGLFIVTLTGVLFWQLVMHQHAMVHAFTARHFDYFVAIGIAWLIKSVSTLASRNLFWAIIIFVGMHSIFSVGSVDFEGFRRDSIRLILNKDQLSHWVCTQKPRVFASNELEASKKILVALGSDTCSETLDVKKASRESISAVIANLILFLR